MKRLIAAVSFAVLAVPAVAAGLPYDQNLVDRALPSIEAPRTVLAAASGDTRSDLEIATDANFESTKSPWATGPWADDYHFIAPAQ